MINPAKGWLWIISTLRIQTHCLTFWQKLSIGFASLIVVELFAGGLIAYLEFIKESDYLPGHDNELLNTSQMIHQPSVSPATVFALLGMIIFGTVAGGLLFWSLGSYVIRSRQLLDHVSDGVVMTGSDWKIHTVNNPLTKITGYSQKQMVGQYLCNKLPGCKAFGMTHSSGKWSCEYQGLRPDGTEYMAEILVVALQLTEDKGVNYLVTLRDVTEIKASERRIKKLAYVDELTGLPNRRFFQNRLDQLISYARRHEQKLALLFMDLDGFKDINDSLGHDAGDLLLKIMAKRFKSSIRDSDLVARLGGDEFCIVLSEVEDPQVPSVIAQRCLIEGSKPVTISQQLLQPRVSIGIALFPDDASDKASLLQSADTAMYSAKQAGKNQYSYYSRELTEEAACRLKLEHDLRQAIDDHQFELYYQPQVSLLNGELAGVEALIRWNHPERGLVSPIEFIDAAEKIGVIHEIGEWVLETACTQTAEWRKQGLNPFRMAVNISASHFRRPELSERVQQALKKSGLEPESLELEITESVMQVSDESLATFKRLQELGIAIAIDDFGTGYSSLSSLKKLPIDSLKLDRDFISDVVENAQTSVIIATIIAMGKALGLQIVAEGVETQEQLEYLHGLGCDLVQGYYFSKPVPANQIPDLARKGFMPGKNVNSGQANATAGI